MELTDLDADRQLLALEGVSLLVFTSEGCASCRWARRHLPAMDLPIERLCWVDAGRNGGLVERYGVFHLPALFMVRDGRFHGALNVPLHQEALRGAVLAGSTALPEELP
nr:thioredoxin family protein [Pseudomonas aeruginosa]